MVSLKEASDLLQHNGSCVHPARQVGAHAHVITPNLDGRFVLAVDLGLNKLFIYRLDQERGKLHLLDTSRVISPPGSGPRRLAFHPNGRFTYVINELNSTISMLDFNIEKGFSKDIQIISTLPVGYQQKNTTGEIVIIKDGKFVYASKRYDRIIPDQP